MRLEQPIAMSVPPDLSQPLVDARRLQVDQGDFQVQRVVFTEGPRAGCELILVEHGNCRVAICPTRGMSLWKADLDGLACGWRSPVAGPIHPQWVPLHEPSGIGWLEGFDELLVRCGARALGPPEFDERGNLLHPLHGRLANLPAEDVHVEVDASNSTLTISGEVHECRVLQHHLRLRVIYTFAWGQPRIQLRDKLTNLGGSTTTAQLLYHINLGQPLLCSESEFSLSAAEIAPRDEQAAEGLDQWNSYLPPTVGYAEQVFFSQPSATDSGRAIAMLHHPRLWQAFAVHFDPRQLPCFSQWKNTAAEVDGYVTGLEPATCFPNPRSFEERQGRLLKLAPEETRTFDLELEAIHTREQIDRIAHQIAASLPETGPKLLSQHESWCQ